MSTKVSVQNGLVKVAVGLGAGINTALAVYNANKLYGYSLSSAAPGDLAVPTWIVSTSSYNPVVGGGGGQTNTASNVGVSGIDVFKQKAGVDFEFRAVQSVNDIITVALSSALNAVQLTGNTNRVLTSANKGLLTGAANTTLHFHTADRARASHTGNQLASTISNFSAAVAGTASVTANTGHASATNNPHAIAIDTILPNQSAHNGKFLTTNSSAASWSSISGFMAVGTYDPNSVAGDAFDMALMVSSVSAKVFTLAEQDKLSNIEISADVTDATNVNAAGATMNSDFNANTMLAASANNTPFAITVSASQIVGRAGSGNIKALTATEVRTIINVENSADVTTSTNVNAAGAVMNTDFSSYSILATSANSTPNNLIVPVSTFLGRKSTGIITAMSIADAKTELSLTNVDDVKQAPYTLTIKTITASTYTLLSSDQTKYLIGNSVSAQTFLLPAGLNSGFQTIVKQKGAGAISFISAASTQTVNIFSSFTKTGGQHALCSILIPAENEFDVGGNLA